MELKTQKPEGRLPSPVGYEIYREPGRLPRITEGKSYVYLLAGNGLWKYAESLHFRAVIPIGPANVAGLPPLEPVAVPLAVDLPSYMLSKILEDARRLAWDAPREVMYHIRETPSGIVSITRPDQTGTAAHLSYAGGGDADILADIHSHCQMSAYFSETDDRDEQGLRFYGVIGRIFTQPEIRLRVGIYGDHWPVPITALFDGPGPFIDRYEENDSWKR